MDQSHFVGTPLRPHPPERALQVRAGQDHHREALARLHRLKPENQRKLELNFEAVVASRQIEADQSTKIQRVCNQRH